MSSTTTPTVRSLYRRLLRELPPLPVPRHRAPRTPIHASIRKHFSDPAQTQAESLSEAAARARRQEVEQLVAYLRAQRMYGTLLQRYNPGMGMDEEERVRLTARRVGMEMPVEWKAKQ
ncbi:hypothetical protein ABEF95_012623 [Exophiala dermatitidis]